MVRKFRDRRTERFAAGDFIPAFSGFQPQAERLLQYLLNASELSDLRLRPGWRLEALKGDRAGQYSVRINDQWRICFVWQPGEGPVDIEIVDYH
jgi:proteic killer suppression protein